MTNTELISDTPALYLNETAKSSRPGLISRVNYSLMGPTFSVAQKRPLTTDDFPPLQPEQDSHMFAIKAIRSFDDELTRMKAEDWKEECSRHNNTHNQAGGQSSHNWIAPLLSNQPQGYRPFRSDTHAHAANHFPDVDPLYFSSVPPPSMPYESYRRETAPLPLARSLAKSLWVHLLLLALIMVVETVNRCSQALLVGQLISTVKSYNDAVTEADRSHMQSQGFMFASIMAASAFCATFLHHAYFHLGCTIGMHVRQTLMTMIHRKVLRLDIKALQMITAGQISNMMSSDVARFDKWGQYIHSIWMSPIEVVVLCYLLSLQVGIVSAIAAVCTLMLIMPIQSYSGRVYGRLRTIVSKIADERVRLIRECIMNIRVIKQYAWESFYKKSIDVQRSDEVNVISQGGNVKSLNQGLYMASTPLICLAMFTTYKFLGGALTSDVVFVSISLLGITRKDITTRFSTSCESFSDCWVALKRISTLLMLPEVDCKELPQYVKHTPLVLPVEDDIAMSDINYLSSSALQASIHEYNLVNDQGKCGYVACSPDQYCSHGDMSISITDCTVDFSKQQTNDTSLTTVLERVVSKQPPVLKNLSLALRGPQVVLIVGPVGSGKSTLCKLLLKEVSATSPTSDTNNGVSVCGSLAYVSQEPWIFEGSIRDNITMGRVVSSSADAALYEHNTSKRYDNDTFTQLSISSSTPSVRVRRGGDEWLNQVIFACALHTDLDIMQHGLDTHVSEKTLSGGQKARIALARAVYSDAEVMLLDDPLSAVDSRTSEHLINHCIFGLLKDKMVLLVTHQIQFMHRAEFVVWVGGGSAVNQDLNQQGMCPRSPRADIAGEPLFPTSFSPDISVCGNVAHGPVSSLLELPCFVDLLSTVTSNQDDGEHPSPDMISSASKSNSAFRLGYSTVPSSSVVKPKEQSSVGSVSMATYKHYIQSMGGLKVLIPLLLLAIFSQCTLILADLWISYWVRVDENAQRADNTDSITRGADFHMGVYAILTLVIFPIAFSRAYAWLNSLFKASKCIHSQAINKVLFGRVTWFDTQSVGTLINRFSNDISAMDELIPITITDLVQTTLMCAACLIMVIVTSPWAVLALAPLSYAFVKLRRYYLNASQQMKRLESQAKSPILAQVSNTINNLITVRSTPQASPVIHSTFVQALRLHDKHFYNNLVGVRWFGLRLDALSTSFFVLTAFLAVITMGSVDASLVGLTLSYVLQLLNLFQYTVRISSDAEVAFVSVERVVDLLSIPQERRLRIHRSEYTTLAASLNPISAKAPPSWPPCAGSIRFHHVTMRYLPAPATPALTDVCVSIKGGDHVGIVGRTGSGKSTLLMALFRLIELDHVDDCFNSNAPTSTSHSKDPILNGIYIDEVNIASLGLHDLREQLSIIPQEPVLFNGSVRHNLDPFNQCSDELLIEILKKVQLYSVFFPQQINLDGCETDAPSAGFGLDYAITDGGRNISIGQAQLMCLARALTKKVKVLILDEATANVDYHTDKIIQHILFEEFKNQTILIIAHRLRTIINCDNILVMNKGNLVEYGAPHELLMNHESLFKDMVNSSGPENSIVLHDLAKKAFLEKTTQV